MKRRAHGPSTVDAYATVVALVALGFAAWFAWSARARAARTLESSSSRRPTVNGIDTPATGLLAKAVLEGTHHEPTWVEIPFEDMTISVAADALTADVDGRALRLMTSWPDTIAIANKLGTIPASKRIADAIYAAATKKTAFHSLVTASDPASGGAKMHTVEFARRYNDDVDAQLAGVAAGTLVAGHEKYWLLSSRLAELSPHSKQPAAINYGAWTKDGKVQQPESAAHDIKYPGDYSQLYRPVKRYATRTSDGARIDLLDWIETHENVPNAFTSLFRMEEAA